MRRIRIEADQFNFPLRDDSDRGLGLHDGEIPMSEETRKILLDWNESVMWTMLESYLSEDDKEAIRLLDQEVFKIVDLLQNELDASYPGMYLVSYRPWIDNV
jgi:hypothetical protein